MEDKVTEQITIMNEPSFEGVYERKRPMRKFLCIYLFLLLFGLGGLVEDPGLDPSDSPALAFPVLWLQARGTTPISGFTLTQPFSLQHSVFVPGLLPARQALYNTPSLPFYLSPSYPGLPLTHCPVHCTYWYRPNIPTTASPAQVVGIIGLDHCVWFLIREWIGPISTLPVRMSRTVREVLPGFSVSVYGLPRWLTLTFWMKSWETTQLLWLFLVFGLIRTLHGTT